MEKSLGNCFESKASGIYMWDTVSASLEKLYELSVVIITCIMHLSIIIPLAVNNQLIITKGTKEFYAC
jgi:hypothetical protein